MSVKRYWLLWSAVCGAGELLGIGAAAGIAVIHIGLLGEPQTIPEKLGFLLTMIAAGIIEGSVTGFFQWLVLKKRFPGLRARAWMGYTALGAATAWLLGMLPSTFFMDGVAQADAAGMSLALTMALAALMGLVLGAIFGLAQWLELRRHARRAGLWIGANTLAWTIGLALIFLGASLPTETTPLAGTVVIGMFSGLAGGLAVGAVTGIFLLKIEPSPL